MSEVEVINLLSFAIPVHFFETNCLTVKVDFLLFFLISKDGCISFY